MAGGVFPAFPFAAELEDRQVGLAELAGVEVVLEGVGVGGLGAAAARGAAVHG